MLFFLKKISLILFVFLFIPIAKSQSGNLTLKGKVIDANKKNLERVQFKVYKNNILIDSSLTSSSGVFTIKFALNNNYLLQLSKNGYVPKKIILDTQVPLSDSGKFYNSDILIVLDPLGKGDVLSTAGLPILKFYFDLKQNNFVSKSLTNNKGNQKVLIQHIKKLEKELAKYRKLVDEKDKLLKQQNEIKTTEYTNKEYAQLIKQAQAKADSIMELAKYRAKLILEASKKDSIERASFLEEATQTITEKDFKSLDVDENIFKEKESVINYQKEIEKLSQRQHKTAADSLNIQEHKLGLRKEFIELAKAKLENDRLKAKTHEDSLKIQQREAELFLIEQNMQMAAQEIETARKQLELKDLQIRQKNIIIFGVSIGILLILILLVVIYRHYTEKKQMNLILEDKNEKLDKQNKILDDQNKKIKHQNRQILESIDSGKRIQAAILPSNKLLSHFFSESFVFFRPRDIVSGDFYWFSVQDDKLFVAAVDCTGHGVPGAFMSLIGNTLLNHIVNEKAIYTPSEILKELHLGVRQALSQSKAEESEDHADGMDISLCRFDKKNKEITLSLANHTAFIIKNGDVTEVEGDEFGIADELIGEKPEFTDHTYPMDKDAMLYMFSDGFPDQFGGPKNKKFYISKLKQLFIDIEKLPAKEQYEKVSEKFTEWKGNNRQYDDVLVMGFKLDL